MAVVEADPFCADDPAPFDSDNALGFQPDLKLCCRYEVCVQRNQDKDLQACPGQGPADISTPAGPSVANFDKDQDRDRCGRTASQDANPNTTSLLRSPGGCGTIRANTRPRTPRG